MDQSGKHVEPLFVARQPVLTVDGRVWGYELLFRDSKESFSAVIDDATVATVSVVTCGYMVSQDDFKCSKKILINFPDDLIVERAPKALPSNATVVELMEDSHLSGEIYQALLDLKQAGYTIAVDDYQGNSKFADFIDIADIVKVDVLGLGFDEISRIVESLKGKKVDLLAEKVESREEFEQLKELGFTLFQGFYFAKPETLSGRKFSSEQSLRLSILNDLQRPDLDVTDLHTFFRKDVSLSYRLLRFLNSPAFSFSVQIKSLNQAVALIGPKRLKHWLRLVIISDMSSSFSAPELCNMAICRASFFEKLSESIAELKDRAEEMYLFGLFSMLDSLLNMPMDKVVEFLPLKPELKTGLCVEEDPYHAYVQLAHSLERGEWDAVCRFSRDMGLDVDEVKKSYFESLISSARISAELD